MKKKDQFWEELRPGEITVVSGQRPQGRGTDVSGGRRTSGFLYIWQGEATFYLPSGERTLVSAGELVFLPKNKKYKMRYTGERTVFVLVNLELYGEGGEEILPWEEITVLLRDDGSYRLAKLMTSLELCGASRSALASLRKKELLFRLLGLICARGEEELPADGATPQIAAGVRLLEQTYLENLPISQYAEACHISVNYFRSLFQKQLGASPVKYRNRLRIERARELLREGGFTVSEVAYATGFENVGYFCRYYRKVVGETPKQTKNGTKEED